MLKSAITRTVVTCTRHAYAVLAVGFVLALISGYVAVTRFAINTDIGTLISPNLDWRKREIALDQAFPGRYDSILIVVDAATPEQVAQASTALAQKLAANATLFPFVRPPTGGPFFEKSALLFLASSSAPRRRGPRSDS